MVTPPCSSARTTMIVCARASRGPPCSPAGPRRRRHDAPSALHDRLGRRRAAWGGEHRVGGIGRRLADADAQGGRHDVDVADDAVRVDAFAVTDTGGAPGHRRRRYAQAVRERQAGDTGAVATHARVVGDQAADADLEPEAEGHGAGERADHDDVARADVALAVRDRVEDDDMAARVLVDRSQGASLPGAPIIAQWPREDSVAVGFVGLGTLADRRRTGDEVRRGAMALLAPARGRLGGRRTRGGNHVLVGAVATCGLVVIRIDVVLAAHVLGPPLGYAALRWSRNRSSAPTPPASAS